MSPEQARGKAVDKRTDIWAFGCCLYEALTGKAAYLGETVTDTIAKIVEREPDWEALPSPRQPFSRVCFVVVSKRTRLIAFMTLRMPESRSRRAQSSL